MYIYFAESKARASFSLSAFRQIESYEDWPSCACFWRVACAVFFVILLSPAFLYPAICLMVWVKPSTLNPQCSFLGQARGLGVVIWLALLILAS